MIEDANAVMDALVRYKAARDGLAQAPVHLPLASGSYRQSSTFGNRKDPFTGAWPSMPGSISPLRPAPWCAAPAPAR